MTDMITLPRAEVLQVLEALEEVQEVMNTSELFNSRVDALQKRLAQPAQQEPVAWRTKNATPPGGYVVFQQYPQAVADLDGEIEPLYTTPQPRQWQGLTDKEVDECFSRDPRVAARNAEAKLREKNA